MKAVPIKFLLFSVVTSVTVAAAPSGASAERPHGPPPAAFEACAGKSAGDSCTVTFRDRTIDGTCKAFPEDDRLFCRPNHAPPEPPPNRSNP
jgi:hypothetical protein